MVNRPRRWARFGALGLLLGFCLAVGGFRLSGGRWMDVRTPSMAQAAPVGTLLLTRPIGGGDVNVGQFIVFHPPTAPGQTYAHRVVAIDPDGAIHTKGDLNDAADPWTLRRGDVAGTVVLRVWGVGWLLRALPVLILGEVAVAAACHWLVGPRNRALVGTVGCSFVVAAVLVWLRPLVRGNVLRLDPGHASLVGTGLLPIQARATGAPAIVLSPGQKGALDGLRPTTAGTYHVQVSAHLSPLVWVVLIACWLVPLAVLLVIGVERPRRVTS